MDKINFSSEVYPFGNYLIKFKRSDNRSKNIVNIIEIYSQEKNKILDLKFDKSSGIYLYDLMLGLSYDYNEFEYKLPIYNTSLEIVTITGIIDTKIPNEIMPQYNNYLYNEYKRIIEIDDAINNNLVKAATILISKEKDNQLLEVAASFTLEDFDKFVYIFYFLLLIDVIDPSYHFYQ